MWLCVTFGSAPCANTVCARTAFCKSPGSYTCPVTPQADCCPERHARSCILLSAHCHGPGLERTRIRNAGRTLTLAGRTTDREASLRLFGITGGDSILYVFSESDRTSVISPCLTASRIGQSCSPIALVCALFRGARSEVSSVLSLSGGFSWL